MEAEWQSDGERAQAGHPCSFPLTYLINGACKTQNKTGPFTGFPGQNQDNAGRLGVTLVPAFPATLPAQGCVFSVIKPSHQLSPNSPSHPAALRHICLCIT